MNAEGALGKTLAQVKIISLNLFEGGLLWDNIVAFLTKENADILCLQEVFNGDTQQPAHLQTVPRLKTLFPDFFFYYAPELEEIRSDGRGDVGNAILSRWPLQDEKTIFLHGEYQKIVRPLDEKSFSHYPKNMVSAVVEVPNSQPLHVLNLHGVWGIDGNDNPERLKMSEIIISKINGKKPLALMGDFNLVPNTDTIARIEQHLTNVFKDELTTTFNMRHKTNPGYATAVVDMFFVTPEVRVLSHECPDDDVSDHKPLVVTLEI